MEHPDPDSRPGGADFGEDYVSAADDEYWKGGLVHTPLDSFGRFPFLLTQFAWDSCVYCMPRWHVHAVHETIGHQCWLDDVIRPTREDAEEYLFEIIEGACDSIDIPYLRSEWHLIHTVPICQN